MAVRWEWNGDDLTQGEASPSVALKGDSRPFVRGSGKNPMLGIGLKVGSVCLFLIMAGLLKASASVPVGQMIFFRSLFAILPIIVFLQFSGQLIAGFKTKRPFAHLLRGALGAIAMGLVFFALTRLPLPEAVAIHYAAPLVIVILSAVLLGEQVRIYRWSAVFVGLVGVLIITWPRLTLFSGDDFSSGAALGAAAALAGACLAAFAALSIRALVQTEKSATIVLYFSIISTLIALASVMFGWVWLTLAQSLYLVLAGILGGVAQIMMTESFRHADMSVIAPFEYVSLPLSMVIGFVFFADVPTLAVLFGGAIVVFASIFIIYRERQLGLERARARKVMTPHG